MGFSLIERNNMPHDKMLNKSLIKDVRSCTLCAHSLPSGPRPVIQVHPDAKILIAGQAPGRRVHMTGVPFDDPSGDRLRDWMGVDKSTFYNSEKIAILPMGFCFPGTGKSGDLPPRKECAKEWREKLLKLMPKIQLTLVIGQYAIDWHLKDQKKKNLTDTVKSWEDFWPLQLPLPHPSPRNNIWLKKNVWFEEEITPVLRGRVNNIL